MKDNTIGVFFALLRAGLWADIKVNGERLKVKGSSLTFPKSIDWEKVYQLAAEQSVIGVVLAGIEHSNVKPPQELLLQWIGEVHMLEQQNKAMNQVVAELVRKMRANDIYTLLVKGQGIAQCYERPLWRSCGDVDFYLSDDDYFKAKKFFRPLVDKFDPDTETALHINMHYGDWVVEIHANQHCSLSARVNSVMDEIHRDIFYGGNVRCWNNSNTQVFLPSPDNDVLIIFIHFINHFYKGGLGVRQICDWSRLLWTYNNSLNQGLLESRIRKMGLMNVWKAFGAFAVGYLGMPVEAMPLFNESDNQNHNLRKKAERICNFVMEVGNFGHNRDSSYYRNESKLVRKFCSFRRRCGDMWRHARIFPLETLSFFPNMVYNGLKAVAKGE